MRTHPSPLLTCLGLKAAGDIGPYTIWTSKRNKLVLILKAPPEKPPSYLQLRQRNRWRIAAQQWRALPPAARARWALAAARAHVRCTGYNLHTAYVAADRADLIRTIERQTSLQLLTPA
jgi:hypothetical protein